MTLPCCRICYGEEGELLSLCKCSGTMKYVHAECMERWIQYSRVSRCTICNTHIVKHKKYDKKWMKIIDNTTFDHIFTLIFIGIVGCSFRWALEPLNYISARMKWYYGLELMNIILIILFFIIHKLKDVFTTLADLEELFPCFPLPQVASTSSLHIVYCYMNQWIAHHKLNFIKTKMVFNKSQN